ncbi:MAG: hypothetical protein HY082_08340 [Gammaproteobacteria bacterium]|nr:hypothetical protein [Gammaproteobacteria bacterium]
MTNSKIDMKLGALSFAGEGDQAWLAEQLDKVLKAAPEISRTSAPTGKVNPPGSTSNTIVDGQFPTTLATYIREKGGDANQVDRFLITADWLRRRGEQKLTTSAVGKALRDSQQKRLANPADSLNKNVTKGYCEKADGGFYITPDGLKKLGYDA